MTCEYHGKESVFAKPDRRPLPKMTSALNRVPFHRYDALCRAGIELCVIRIDVVLGDVRQFIRIEQVLIGGDAGRQLSGNREIRIGAESAIDIRSLEFDAGVRAAGIVECREDVSCTELSVIE